MKRIISSLESRRILRNLYKKEAVEAYADQLHNAGPEERAQLLAKIDEEARQKALAAKVYGRGG
jgi:hypothetical protein